MKRTVVNVITGQQQLIDLTPEEIAEIESLSNIPPTLDDYRRAIDQHVEDTARGRGYNSATSLASYVASTVPTWQAEAQVFVAWRDQVWVTTFQALQSGDDPGTTEALIQGLPPIQWPE